MISLGFTPGDVVIITGAGSGIGRATARNAAAIGLSVAAWDMNADGVAQTVHDIKEAGGLAVAVTADVTSDAQVATALDASGTARYLVNNAGPASGGAPLEFDEAVTIGLGSVRRVTTAWLDRGAQEGAALVNVASVAGNVVGTSPDWYPATKAGIAGYTRHLATYRSDVVRANAVAPGMVDTPRLAGFAASDLGQKILSRVPVHRLGTPDEIAWAILFLLSPLASYINGVLLVADGGWTITQ
ncbi:MAG TPA: SDR family oxidoreductase [Streptosporangiaceae bacterium]|jgi:NAD(P)-dependent dehydrogenase (short-subunit alcohol dehydrogenase family)|nr:SDR family oxidoreductase [Streptosporangiaceae bacterium]